MSRAMLKRYVCELPGFPIGIFGVETEEGTIPPSLMDSPVGPINLITTKTRYHLYRPVIQPQLAGTKAHPSQR